MTMSHWQPSATIKELHERAKIIQTIRSFFNARGYLEVDTPTMARFGVSDVYLSNIKAFFRQEAYCLQTSPEYHMKRLLAAGSGPVFQLARVFRDDELGRWHNPEFTLLEWYQLGIDHHALMDEMEALLQTVLGCGAMLRKTYQQVFLESCSLDPLVCTIEQFQQTLKRYQLEGILAPGEQDRDQYLFLLMTHVVEQALAKETAPVAIYNYPVSQAALAKINQGVAERFEVYYRGIELANGFHELTDSDAQRKRFDDDNAARKKQGLPFAPPDHFLLAALDHGLPPCSGVALGVDRLIALSRNHTSISEAMAFDFSRA